jgi:hypothetical protein
MPLLAALRRSSKATRIPTRKISTLTTIIASPENFIVVASCWNKPFCLALNSYSRSAVSMMPGLVFIASLFNVAAANRH